ncbi:alpha/beta fold hydrolase [Roseateles sp. P5_E7]
MTTKKQVLFIQGGGEGAHAADAPLAASLRRELGAGYEVHYPQMRGEDEPSMEPWKRQIGAELSKLHGTVTLVGHSLGGAMLLSYLAERAPPIDVNALVLLAAPAWDGERWAFDELVLPDDLAERLGAIPQLLIYHCRDDETVPFAHLALHAAKLPQAITVTMAHGGHQFGDDLQTVAADIRAVRAG